MSNLKKYIVSGKDADDVRQIMVSNSIRNFLKMNAIHSCSNCGTPELIFPTYLLKKGHKPKCSDCATPEEIKVYYDGFKKYKYLDSGKDMEWEANEEHMLREHGLGCKTCVEDNTLE